MLYTRNAFFFRKFYKEEVAREQGWLDLNFVGSLHPDKTRKETGFSKLIYGNREDLGKLLGTIALNVAADDQAIYELIQNADDCKSSFFSVSYNEKYLLCINNGNYFSDQDMSAIINVAGNYKEGEDIGTFGIGFKILHRLVGKDDGREAIINNYAGPIIFSWNKFFQLNGFLNGDEIKVGYDAERDNDNAWFVKLLYTCFPSHLGEKVRLQDYDTQDIKFTETELGEMREFLKNSLQNVNLTETNNLKSGSIFFLKLGEGKSKFLDDGIEKIKSGLSYSFKFLNSLKKIYINGEEIKAQGVMDYSHSFPIGSLEFNAINPKNKKRDIKFTFAYYKDYKKAENLRDELVPNLYTFFSMDEEKNGFSFLLHCNAFDMNNDRRKLQANSQINEKLLPIIASDVIQYIDNQKEKNRNLFLSLYANLLLSKESKSKPHINSNFYKFFKEYIFNNIPTSNGYSNNALNVKIKNTFLEIQPADFGCPEIDWFYWNNEKYDGALIDEARISTKLNLDKWDIIDLLKYAVDNGKIKDVDDWVKQLEFETSQLFAEEKRNTLQEGNRKSKPYYSLLSEINKNILKSNFAYISKIKLFKFSDGNFYSLNEIFNNDDLILNYEKIFEIRFELQSIGLITSFINIEKYSNIRDLINNNLNDLSVFQQIAYRVKDNHFRKEQKQKLFIALQEFDGVGAEKLKDLELFKDAKGNIRPLRNLLKGNRQVPNWLFPYINHIAEYIPELDKYLVKDTDIYKEIILPNWENIIETIANANIQEFYKSVKYFYDLNEDNKPLKTQRFVYTTEGFKFAHQVFFNSEIPKLGNLYIHFQNAVQSLFDLPTPDKLISAFLITDPFKLDASKFCGRALNAVTLDVHDIKAVLSFCKLNNEQFFKNFIIKRVTNGYILVAKTNATYQITSPDNEARKFIEDSCADKLFVLPHDFLEYKDEDGIVKADDLHTLILESVNVNLHKKALVDIVKYRAKLQFLQKLSEIRLNAEIDYTKDNYEYKVLELACSEITDFTTFRQKIIIETNGKRIKLIDIQPFVNKITFCNVELLLSEIVPESYQYSKFLSNMIEVFIQLGLPPDRLNTMFGMNKTPDIQQIFALVSKHSTLHNWQQLCFVYLYNTKFSIALSNFKIKSINGQYYVLGDVFYLQNFSFIQDSRKLSEEYTDIKNHIACPNQYFLIAPYFTRSEFKCPYVKTIMADEQKKELIEFLYQHWNSEDKKSIVRNVDWSKINDNDSLKILGFNPQKAILPNEYAYRTEKLPDYVAEWINGEDDKISFLSDLGVWTEKSVIIELRKFWTDKCNSFENRRLLQELKFNVDGIVLRNSLLWLIEQQKELNKAKHIDSLEIVIKILNSQYGLAVKTEYDYQSIVSNSTIWDSDVYNKWKLNSRNRCTISLHKGELPKLVKISGLSYHENYVFIRYREGNRMRRLAQIFINKNSNIKDELHSLSVEPESPFMLEDLWQLFNQESSNEKELLAEKDAEIERLRKQLSLKSTADIDLGGFSNDLPSQEQINWNEEARKIVKEELEQQGYIFTKGIGSFGIIDGVVKNGIGFPLVVLSIRGGKLFINPNQWLQLCKPNSKLLGVGSNREIRSFELKQLLGISEEFNLRFKVEKMKDQNYRQFAEIFHYFSGVNLQIPINNRVGSTELLSFFPPRKTEDDIIDTDSDLIL